MRTLLRPVLGLFLFCILAFAANAQTPPMRIMPLGDSITFGSGGTANLGGYRGTLYTLLTNAGYNVDFVGTQTGNSSSMADPDHQGHGGWRIDQLDTNMAGWLSSIADPDIVLMHIGTNDFGQGYNTATAIDRLDALILKIATARPYAHIVVTNLMERGGAANTAIEAEFNPFVESRVNAHAAAGRKVSFLDMRSAVPLADMPDNLHPNQTGYDKMAAAWANAITVFTQPGGDFYPPAIARANASADLTKVNITFSKPVADTAANVANYALSGGLTISAAELDSTKRVVTLSTSELTLGTNYTVTVNNVADRMEPTGNAIAPNSTATFSAPIPRGYLNHIAEATGYTLAYSLDVPTIANYRNVPPAYSVDNRTAIGPFTRVAYYVELQGADGALQYLWASMDAFTTDVNMIAVPHLSTGAIFQQSVANLNVVSNAPGIVNGSGLTGNLEFWPSNYSHDNAANVPGASGAIYDFGDSRTATGTYGSMQLHNPAAGQTLFAFNNWGGTATTGSADFGIGNNPAASATNAGPQKDWTFSNNAGNYSVRTIQVLVQTSGDLTAPAPVAARASFGRTSIRVTFSEPLAAASVKAENFVLDNGVIVLGTTLAENQREVILATTAQPAGTPLTLAISGVRDTSPNANLIAAGTTIAVVGPQLPAEITTNVGAAANGYHVVYSADLPTTGNFNALGSAAYALDERNGGGPFTRVAYYLELQKPGAAAEFIWVSMDAFTTNRARIGVPLASTGALFQRNVTNMDVISNVGSVTTGTGIATGNLEFWPSNYAAPKAAASPANASDTTFDFGDSGAGTGAGHGSMQVHDHGAGKTLFAMNNFGTDGQPLALGIGSQPSGNPDWTFAANAASYSRRVLHVLVLPGATTSPAISALVPEAANYQLAYSLDIPTGGNLVSGTGFTPYTVNNGADVGSFTRVAYYLELQKTGDASPSYVWASMDAFTPLGTRIGVPTPASGAVFQGPVNNLNVASNVAGIVTGTGITTGNIEFWPTNYTAAVTAGVLPGNPGSGTAFDFNDTRSTTGSHGSMQIHNYGAGQTLFALSNWGTATNTTNVFGLGIGNNPTGAPDYTLTANAATYNVKRVLHVYVLPGDADATAPIITGIVGSATRDRLVVTFNEPVAEISAVAGNFTIDGGLTVTSARLLPGNREIALTTTAQTPGQLYTVSATGVRDRSAKANLIAPGASATFTAFAAPAVLENVAEIADYKLIYRLAIPATSGQWNVNTIPYGVNEAKYGEQLFDRVAYLMELDNQWVYVSFDPFTNSITKIGVPTLGVTATAFQQKITRMNVDSNVAGVVTGEDIATGNIEFWGGNYNAANALAIPNASATAYDFGDTMTAGGHGSMQVHNHGESQVLFAYNAWGNVTSTSDTAIGNNPNASGTQGLDWTFSANAPTFTTRNLYVLIRPGGEPTGPGPQFYAHPTSRTVVAGTSTTFAVSMAGSGPFTYQWRFNGTPISGATNPWLEISPVTAAEEGDYDVVVTNAALASSTSLAASLTINTAPTFAGYRFVARLDTPATVSHAALLAKASDADGGTLTITGASAASTQGGQVQQGATAVTYTPAAGFTGSDTFTVFISDGQGGTINGVVHATVSGLLGDPAFDGKIGIRADGKVEALFAGTPGAGYVIERTTNLLDPAGWEVIATGTVGDDGLIPVLDAAPPEDQAFYRARATAQ